MNLRLLPAALVFFLSLGLPSAPLLAQGGFVERVKQFLDKGKPDRKATSPAPAGAAAPIEGWGGLRLGDRMAPIGAVVNMRDALLFDLVFADGAVPAGLTRGTVSVTPLSNRISGLVSVSEGNPPGFLDRVREQLKAQFGPPSKEGNDGGDPFWRWEQGTRSVRLMLMVGTVSVSVKDTAIEAEGKREQAQASR